jgi:hypothetical protein
MPASGSILSAFVCFGLIIVSHAAGAAETTKSERGLDEVLSGAENQNPGQTDEGLRAWNDLLTAGEKNNWPATAQKAAAFLNAPGFHEPLQTQFAQTLALVVSEKASPEADALQQQLNELNFLVENDQRALNEARKRKGDVTVGQLFTTIFPNSNVNGLIPKPVDPTIAAQQDLDLHLKQRADCEQRLRDSRARYQTEKSQLRNVVLTNLKALEENQMTRPLVILAGAYQYVVPFDVEVASYAQNYASVTREADKIIEAALHGARALEEAGKYWSAHDAAANAEARVDEKVTDDSLLRMLHRNFDSFNKELVRREAVYKQRFSEIIQAVGSRKYSEAVELRKAFGALERQFADNPALAEDEAAFNNALSVRFDEQMKDRVQMIQTVVSEGHDFEEARKLIDQLAKEGPSDDPFTIAVVKSLVAKQRRGLFNREIVAINKRLDDALDQISPYGSSETTQLKAGNVAAFSAVKIWVSGRTNFIKAQAVLEGVNSELAELDKDNSELEAAQRGRLEAAEKTSRAAMSAVRNGLESAGRTTWWVFVFLGAFVVAVAGSLFLLLKHKRIPAV